MPPTGQQKAKIQGVGLSSRSEQPVLAQKLLSNSMYLIAGPMEGNSAVSQQHHIVKQVVDLQRMHGDLAAAAL